MLVLLISGCTRYGLPWTWKDLIVDIKVVYYRNGARCGTVGLWLTRRGTNEMWGILARLDADKSNLRKPKE
jgi:hypothetical protein